MTQCDKCDGQQRHCPRCFNRGAPLIGKSYAGIGSRETPLPVIAVMSNLAMSLALQGWVLRSGHAKPPLSDKRTPSTDSADLAFEKGATLVGGLMVIRTPTIYQPALDHAARHHPNWEACNEHARALHARNSLIMCGDWFDDMVQFVICWTPEARVTGGTGQALRIAEAVGVPVFNLAHADAPQRLERFIEG